MLRIPNHNNARVPGNTLIQPAQAYVDHIEELTRTYYQFAAQHLSWGMDLSYKGITYIDCGLAALCCGSNGSLAGNHLTTQNIDQILLFLEPSNSNGAAIDLSGGTNGVPSVDSYYSPASFEFKFSGVDLVNGGQFQTTSAGGKYCLNVLFAPSRSDSSVVYDWNIEGTGTGTFQFILGTNHGTVSLETLRAEFAALWTSPIPWYYKPLGPVLGQIAQNDLLPLDTWPWDFNEFFRTISTGSSWQPHSLITEHATNYGTIVVNEYVNRFTSSEPSGPTEVVCYNRSMIG